jgi:hypothetical protein
MYLLDGEAVEVSIDIEERIERSLFAIVRMQVKIAWNRLCECRKSAGPQCGCCS